MDVVKIGKFIVSCRKAKGYTQADLAEMLDVTDGAVSKWERGKSMPDSSIMVSLCEILSTNVNELLRGERIEMENEAKISEELIVMLKEMEERKSEQLLLCEKIMAIIAMITLAGLFGIAFCISSISNIYSILLFVLATVIIFGYIGLGILMEQANGYYKCSECGHVYIAPYKNILLEENRGRRRKMCCPKCKETNYHEKVIHREQ